MPDQPPAEMIDRVRQIPIYRSSLEQGHFPILEKSEIGRGFPENWMTPTLAEALEKGEAEFVLSTGTNHARMQIIRPPYFLLKSYYRIWSDHPDIATTWQQGCQRVSITTVLATEHVARVNAKKRGVEPKAFPSSEEPSSEEPSLEARRLDARTLYLNLRLDPALWERSEVERMLDEISVIQQAPPLGGYHLDCSSYYLAHLVRKVSEWDLWKRFPKPASIVHAYEFTPVNVKKFLHRHFECPVIDLFGSTELGYLYYSDREGRFQPYLDDMSVELIPIAPGSTTYSLIVSSVRNPFMPLIRYRTGDCAQTIDGTPDPAKIARFCGRELELLWRGGNAVSQGDLDTWISDVSPAVFTYQLHVEGTSRARLHYTTFDERPISPTAASELTRKFFEVTGLHCDLEHRSHIAIGKSGKYAWLVKHGEPTE